MPRFLRWSTILAFAIVLVAGPADQVFSQEPDRLARTHEAVEYFHGTLESGSQHRFNQIVEQTRGAQLKCGDVAVAIAILGDADLVVTDANLGSGDGSRLCIFKDRTWDSYIAHIINQKSVTDWRRAKEQFLSQIGGAGVEPCKVAQWLAPESAIKRQLTQADVFDAGTRCDPVVFSRGPKSDERMDEAFIAIQDSSAKAEEIYGWALVRALHIFIYDDHDAFVTGVWKDGGHDEVSPRDMEDVCGVAMQVASGNMGFLADISCFKSEGGLRALIAHEYAHIAQGGAMGSTSNLPFFAIEGGAEYFASLVVGHEQRQLVSRFREAIHDQYGRRPPALKSMVRRPSGANNYAAYSRGYAAFRFLTQHWGEDVFRSLHQDYPKGNSDRFLAGMTHITGQSLDDFDAALGTWLREQKDTLPPPSVGPNTTLVADSLLGNLTTVRPIGNGAFDENPSYARTDPALVVLMEWKCLDRAVKVDLNLVRPDGTRHAQIKNSAGPGCSATPFIAGLDTGVPGRTIRSFPGTWRVELLADGRIQGSTTFNVEQ
jgi:hypothetical protein